MESKPYFESQNDWDSVYGNPNELKSNRINKIFKISKDSKTTKHPQNNKTHTTLNGVDSLDSYLQLAELPQKQSFVSFIQENGNAKNEELLVDIIDSNYIGNSPRTENDSTKRIPSTNIDVVFQNKMDTLKKREIVLQKLKSPTIQILDENFLENKYLINENVQFSEQLATLKQLSNESTKAKTKYNQKLAHSIHSNDTTIKSNLPNKLDLQNKLDKSNLSENRPDPFTYTSKFKDYLILDRQINEEKILNSSASLLFQKGEITNSNYHPNIFSKDKTIHSSKQLENLQNLIDENENWIPEHGERYSYSNTLNFENEFSVFNQVIEDNFLNNRIKLSNETQVEKEEKEEKVEKDEKLKHFYMKKDHVQYNSFKNSIPTFQKDGKSNEQMKKQLTKSKKFSLRERLKQEEKNKRKSTSLRKKENKLISISNINQKNAFLSFRLKNMRKVFLWLLKSFNLFLPRLWKLLQRLFTSNPYMQTLRYAQSDNQRGVIVYQNHAYQPWSNYYHSFD